MMVDVVDVLRQGIKESIVTFDGSSYTLVLVGEKQSLVARGPFELFRRAHAALKGEGFPKSVTIEKVGVGLSARDIEARRRGLEGYFRKNLARFVVSGAAEELAKVLGLEQHSRRRAALPGALGSRWSLSDGLNSKGIPSNLGSRSRDRMIAQQVLKVAQSSRAYALSILFKRVSNAPATHWFMTLRLGDSVIPARMATPVFFMVDEPVPLTCVVHDATLPRDDDVVARGVLAPEKKHFTVRLADADNRFCGAALYGEISVMTRAEALKYCRVTTRAVVRYDRCRDLDQPPWCDTFDECSCWSGLAEPEDRHPDDWETVGYASKEGGEPARLADVCPLARGEVVVRGWHQRYSPKTDDQGFQYARSLDASKWTKTRILAYRRSTWVRLCSLALSHLDNDAQTQAFEAASTEEMRLRLASPVVDLTRLAADLEG